MTSQAETGSIDRKLSDLQKKFGEEKKAHGETILQLLSAQAQAQTAEFETAKAQKLVTETTLKLDQAREEIRGLRDHAQEAQAKIADLESQMAQMRSHEQSQAQIATEAQEEIRVLRAQVQGAQVKIDDLEARMAQMKVVEQSRIAIEAQAQELQEAHAKITSLEALMAKTRAVFSEYEVATNPEPRDEELRAAQAKIEKLEVQMAQLKVVEQYQAQTQQLLAAQEKIKDLEAQMAQSEKLAKEEMGTAQAKIEDLEAKVQSRPKAPVQVPTTIRRVHVSPPLFLDHPSCLKIENMHLSAAPWFGPHHLRFFEGTHLGLGQSGLMAGDMVQFLDSWLADSHPYLETIILNDFLSAPTSFDKFESSLVRNYNGGNVNRSSTFLLERPSDGRIACVKVTRYMFMFVV